MTVDGAVRRAATTVLTAIRAATALRPRRGIRLDRPAPQPLPLDPLGFDPDGPVIDLEPA